MPENETILRDSQPIPAQNGVTRFTDEEVGVIVEARQRLSRAALGMFEDMIRELHLARISLEKENETKNPTAV